MSKNEVKVPQKEIGGQKYHETAKAMFSVEKVMLEEKFEGESRPYRIYRLERGVSVAGKLTDVTLVREDSDLATILNQLDIEIRKEIKKESA